VNTGGTARNASGSMPATYKRGRGGRGGSARRDAMKGARMQPVRAAWLKMAWSAMRALDSIFLAAHSGEW